MAYASPAPPLTKAHFKVLSDGLPDGYCTKAVIPPAKAKMTKVQTAGYPQEVKFPSGLAEYDDLELSFIHGNDGIFQQWVRTWLRQVHNPVTGQTGVPPQDAKRTIVVQQYAADGSTLVKEWECVGCVMMDPGKIDLEAGKEEAVVVDCKFSVDYVDERR